MKKKKFIPFFIFVFVLWAAIFTSCSAEPQKPALKVIIIPKIEVGEMTGDNYWKGIYGHTTADFISEYYECSDPYMVTEMEEIAIANTAECLGLLDRIISLRVIVNKEKADTGNYMV